MLITQFLKKQVDTLSVCELENLKKKPVKTASQKYWDNDEQSLNEFQTFFIMSQHLTIKSKSPVKES